jgi:hypothetical protein
MWSSPITVADMMAFARIAGQAFLLVMSPLLAAWTIALVI